MLALLMSEPAREVSDEEPDSATGPAADRIADHPAESETCDLQTAPDFAVVGIGASAGGLEALEALFVALPPDTGMAFVVVSHLAPTHPSALPAILAQSTSMPVAEAVDDHRLEPDHVYVLPPGSDITSDRGHLHLQPRSDRLHRPIDLFFRSLAEYRRHRAIGIVLSGTATDGTLGVRAIKAAGGITFAQDDSARQPSMPHSAIADGHVDFVLAPQGIAEELVRISKLPRAIDGTFDQPSADDSGFSDILHAVRRETGIDFGQYKESTLRRRLLRRMVLRRIDTMAEYATVLRSNSDEARALHDDLLIGVTSFFRDPEAFDALARNAFPRLVAADRPQEPLRVWVLGCSTGEEAYSLAIALTEYMEVSGVQMPLQLFASDVNESGIRVARSGVYPGDIAQDVHAERLRRFFVAVDGHYRVIKSIRDACIFSRHNLLTDPPFSRIDLVSCRNLLMYLQPRLQDDVIRSLHYALAPSGVLWLGSADTVGVQQPLFEVYDAAHKIFGRRSGTSSHPARHIMSARVPPAESPSGAPGGRVSDLLKDGDRLLLARFAPAAVLLSPHMEVLQYRGDVGRYISPASGKASHQLMQVLDRRLQVAVRAQIAQAEQEQRTVRADAVSILSPDGEARSIAIEVIPVGAPARAYLLLFEPEPAAAPPTRRPGRSRGRPARDQAAALARVTKELADTQAYLEAVIERQEAAREDLEIAHEQAQSANEELQSINEELETSKEEIQSANEELTTLNDELQHRNAELQHTNSDLSNLLTSTDMAVLFVGPDFAIRRFTSSAGRILGLRPADVGRDLRELRLPIDVGLEGLIAETIATATPHEQDLADREGRWRSVRIRPYRTADYHVDGAVIVFVDIDAVVRARLYAESIIATVRTPLVVLDEHLTIVTANDAFCEACRMRPQDMEGRAVFQVADGFWDHPELRRLLERVLPLNEAVPDVAVSITRDGTTRAWMVNARRLAAHSERPLMLLSMEDVSEREHIEGLRRQRLDELAAADQSKNQFLAMLAHELRNPLAPIRAAAAVLGTPGAPAEVADHARTIIERQIQHMVRLIDDLLNLARITQGKIELRLESVELTQLVRRAVEVVQPVIDEREQEVSLSMTPAPMIVLGDAARLEQAFGNLLQNASKFTPRGGHIWVTVGGADPGGDALVLVRDEGIGIAPSMLPHVFELFKQVALSPHQATGLGVGLALVRRILELHGGDVRVQSEGLGRGTEFRVWLPRLRTAAASEPVGPSPTASSVAEHLRILVVDDNRDAADSLTSLLRVWGHDARMVVDGAAALELATQFRPEIVLLDIAMPEMDGYEVARRLRAVPAFDGTVLVAVTGFGRDEDRMRAAEAGFDRHATKPLGPNQLQDLLKPRSSRPHSDID
jgi:two-component system, chemotaxis family, CheB/CheR fusion protein